MTLSKRSVLALSLGVIALRWSAQVLFGPLNNGVPEHFSQLVAMIVLTKIVVMGAILLLLQLGGERWSDLGLKRDAWARHVMMGVAFGVVMFIALNVLLSSVMSSLLPSPPKSGRSVLEFFKSPRNLVVWLPIGIIGGGFVEELERIFILTRFEQWLGRPGLILGCVLSSAAFGQAHMYQGLGHALSIGVSGAVFALLYLRKRSALEPIAAHAFSDVLAMIAATLLAGH